MSPMWFGCGSSAGVEGVDAISTGTVWTGEHLFLCGKKVRSDFSCERRQFTPVDNRCRYRARSSAVIASGGTSR